MGCLNSKAAASPAARGTGLGSQPADAKFMADILVFHMGADQVLQLLTITRRLPPYQGCLALPGGFVGAGEDAETAAARESHEETGVQGLSMVPVGTFDRPGRDPRGPVITNAFFAFSPNTDCKAGGDARSAHFEPVLPLAAKAWSFDHAEIVATALSVATEQAQAGCLEAFLPLEAAAAQVPLTEQLQTCLAAFLASGILESGHLPMEVPAEVLSAAPANGEVAQAPDQA